MAVQKNIANNVVLNNPSNLASHLYCLLLEIKTSTKNPEIYLKNSSY